MLVGEIIYLKRDEKIPADCIILETSDYGIAYVETKGLDGETNLKYKCKPNINTVNINNNYWFNCVDFKCKFVYEHSTVDIYSFNGKLNYGEHYNNTCAIIIDNIILRGSSLKNTEWL